MSAENFKYSDSVWVAYHDRDVQDTKLFLGGVTSGISGGRRARQFLTTVLMVDVEEQSAIFQPLLPPANQGDVFRVPRDLCNR